MKIKKILITGAGGTPSTNFVRSLRKSGERFYFVGVDSNKYYLCRSETHENYLIPGADDPDYIPILQQIIDETSPDLIYSQPDQEILKISEHKDKLNTRTFLPDHKTIELCQDKFQSFQIWKNANIKVPENIIINDRYDLWFAFEKFGSPIWIRSIISPGGGKGSFKATNIDIAASWIDYYNGWNNFIAAECLCPETITWQSIWKNGKLIVAQGRKRLYWEFANRAPSGVTGLTGAGVTISDAKIDEISQQAILVIDKNPNGIFSVDLTYDKNDIPNPTEINIGRFFTTHLFFTRCGLNMPHIFVKLAFDEKLDFITPLINPLPQNQVWIRGMDFIPILTNISTIENHETTLSNRISKI
jgi:carbamoyl-phosphate synthase large subunit